MKISSTLSYATGGLDMRAAAEFFNGAGFLAMAAGGPIDAPQWIPAGSVTGVETRDWKCGPIVSITLARRTDEDLTYCTVMPPVASWLAI